MNKLEEAKDICTRVLLIPYESYAVKLPNGDCIAYKDPATKNDPIKQGKPITIGYGTTFHANGKLVELGEVWTHEYAIEVKKIVLNRFLVEMLKLSPNLIEEPPARIAAVLSWVYNCGLGNYRASTFRRRIIDKNWREAAIECRKWNRGNGKVLKGLVRRREHEAVIIVTAAVW